MSSLPPGRKRRTTTTTTSVVSISEPPPGKPAKFVFLSPRHLLLEVPDSVNSTLPVWAAMLSQQVEQAWHLSPYGLTVSFTARPSTLGRAAAPIKSDPPLGQTPPPKMLIQPVFQSGVSGGDVSGVVLTLLQGQLQCSMATTSLVASLPIIITQTPPPPPPLCAAAASSSSSSASSSSSSSSSSAQSPAELPGAFHTKASANVLVCDRFLLGTCGRGSACPQHHTPLPFHWQLWSVGTHHWVDLPPRAQLRLESIYCDVEQSSITIHLGGDSETLLNFDNMKLDSCNQYDGVRRLGNTSDPALNPHFPNQLKVYWWENGWQEYSQSASKVLLAQRSAQSDECELTVGSQRYKVDFTSKTQTNVATGYQRAVRFRPVYRPPWTLEPHLKTGALGFTEHPDANFNVDPLQEFSGWYPPVWGAVPDQDYRLVEVPAGSKAYVVVQSLFHKSLPESRAEITSIQQVQNLLHWDLFQRYRSHMLKTHSTKEPIERHLFHGTSEDAVDDICRSNFDPRLSGLHGTSLGMGCYFACKAAYSNSYTAPSSDAGVRHMFLAKVLVGRSGPGKSDYRRPPPLGGKRKHNAALCDSCVDNTKTPSMFAVFDSCQCYPYFLIRYRDVPQLVSL